MYDGAEVTTHQPGSHGGLIEVAAMIAEGNCVAVLLLIDARDPHHDDIQNQVLKRVTNKRGIRLVITYADAARWAQFEAPSKLDEHSSPLRTVTWKPPNWRDGFSNDRPLSVEHRTLALTSNHGSKAHMLEFVNAHVHTLALHFRILATGTTGWLLRLLYADSTQEEALISKDFPAQSEDYFSRALANLLGVDHGLPASTALSRLRERFSIVRNKPFSDKVMPLLPGPDGGDILLAHEIIKHTCDTVISFHEPAESRPFGGGGRMIELTCQLPGVATACLDNLRSAEDWVRGLEFELEGPPPQVFRYAVVRERFGLRQVVGVDLDDSLYSESESGQTLLYRTAAGYFHAAVTRLINEGGGRVVVSWGWALRRIVDALKRMTIDGTIEVPRRTAPGLVWSPSVGILPAEPDVGADSIASELRNLYGGIVEAFTRPAYMLEGSLQPWDASLKSRLCDASIVLTSAGPWDEESGLHMKSGVSVDLLPDIGDPTIAGTVGGVFVAKDGSEAPRKSLFVGLDYAGLRKVKKHGVVILVSGGESRREVVQAALNGNLVSVLISSNETVDWLLNDASSISEPAELGKDNDGKVFLTFASRDASLGNEVAQQLRGNGVDVIVEKNIDPLTKRQSRMRNAMESSAAIVVLIGNDNPGEQRATWKLAVEASYNDGLPVLPVMIGDTAPPAWAERFRILRVPLKGQRDPMWDEAMSGIRAWIRGPSPTAESGFATKGAYGRRLESVVREARTLKD
jgi:DNA-binding transcriptional regulator LsrR (DeoR family)/methylglyoxal synthase